MGLSIRKIDGRWRIEDDCYPVPAWVTALIVAGGFALLWAI